MSRGGAKFQCTDFEGGQDFSAPESENFLHPPVHFNNDRSLNIYPDSSWRQTFVMVYYNYVYIYSAILIQINNLHLLCCMTGTMPCMLQSILRWCRVIVQSCGLFSVYLPTSDHVKWYNFCHLIWQVWAYWFQQKFHLSTYYKYYWPRVAWHTTIYTCELVKRVKCTVRFFFFKFF